MDRQQLDRGDAEVAQIVGDRGCGETGVGPAQPFGHSVVELGHALDVQLVDDGVAPPTPNRDIALPVKMVIDDHAEGYVRRRVDLVGELRGPLLVAEDRRVDREVPADRSCERVEEQLGRVEPEPHRRSPRAGHPIAVAGPRPHPGDRAVPPGTAPCQIPRERSVSRWLVSQPSSSIRHRWTARASGAQTAKLVASSDHVAPSGQLRPGHTAAVWSRDRHWPGGTGSS